MRQHLISMETQQVQQRKEEAIHETFITQNQPLDTAEAVEYLDAEDPTDSLEDILIQLTSVASRLIHAHRDSEIEEESESIHTDLEELHHEQEKRRKVILVKLNRASSDILNFPTN